MPTESEPNVAAGTAPSSEERVAPVDTIMRAVDRRQGLRRLPTIAWGAVRIVHDAAPRTIVSSFVLQVVSALLVGAQLLVIKGLVAGLVSLARDTDLGVSTIAPDFAFLLGVTLANGIVAALISLQQEMLTEQVTRRTTDRIIDVATRVPLSRFEDPVFYDELERATHAAMLRPTEMVNSLMSFVLGVLTSVGVMVVIATLEPLLLPLVLLSAVPVLIATLQTSRRTYKFEYGMTTQARERFFLLDLFTERDAAKELRVFNAAPFLRRRYDGLSDERIARMRTFLRGRFWIAVIATLASAIGAAIALGSLVLLLVDGRLSIASGATAALAMFTLSSRLGSVTGSLGKLVESGMFMDDLTRFFEVGERLPEPKPLPARPAGASLGRLSVDHVTFAYPNTDRPVLDDVSLEIGDGEVVAIVGENGSGKTTLVKLLCQLYDVEQGHVRWNGEDVRDIDPAVLRSRMTVLFQDFVEYYLSASENIGLGRSDVPMDQAAIEEAARRADAHRSIAALPDGYATRLGRQFEGGHELSGGQWQRLALARAFYRGGDFLVMDEPTAALDPRAEHQLFEQVRELAAGRSVLLISHRFANVRMADRIYVMEAGRVVEEGRHDELMALDGLYAELFRLQAEKYLQA